MNDTNEKSKPEERQDENPRAKCARPGCRSAPIPGGSFCELHNAIEAEKVLRHLRNRRLQ